MTTRLRVANRVCRLGWMTRALLDNFPFRQLPALLLKCKAIFPGMNVLKSRLVELANATLTALGGSLLVLRCWASLSFSTALMAWPMPWTGNRVWIGR